MSMRDLDLKTFQANNLFSACELVGENQLLQSSTVQKVSLIREYCLPVARSFEKGRQKLVKRCNMMITQNGQIMPTKRFNDASHDDQEKFRNELDSELEKMNEASVRISVPKDLKMEEFYVTTDRDYQIEDKNGNVVTRNMKKGDPMVQARFFMLAAPIFEELKVTEVEQPKAKEEVKAE